MFVEIVGDSVLGNPSDLTVPNTVPDANDSSGTIAARLLVPSRSLLYWD